MKQHITIEIKMYLPMTVIESEDGTTDNEIDGSEHYVVIQENLEMW